MEQLGTRGCSILWTKMFQNAPVMFHDNCVSAIQTAGR
jgi:hypothetical protein